MSQAVARITFGPIHNPIRGLLHGAAGLLSAAIAVQFLLSEALEPRLRAALVVFATTKMALYLISASYHSVPWSPLWKRRMQRADHSMIFLAIAGSITPLAWLGCSEPVRAQVVTAAWVIAALGVAQKAFLPDVHERASIPVQIAQAALVVPALLGLATRHPGAPIELALLGGACYAAGAIFFLTERPRLWPRVFSFHELFHLFVVAGSIAYYALVTGWLTRPA